MADGDFLFANFLMRVWGLETHPLLVEFRGVAADACQLKDAYFHLFLPPPYCRTERHALDYFFFAETADPTTLYCHSNSKYTVLLRENEVVSGRQFTQEFRCKILATSPCVSNGRQFLIYEVDNDFYNIGPVPELSDQVLRCAGSAAEAQRFLKETLDTPKLSEYLEQMDQRFFMVEVDRTNKDEFVQEIGEMMEAVSDIVFEIPEVSELPVGVKRVMNMLIFNAISAKAHYKLIMAFNSAFEADNKRAQHASRFIQPTITIDETKLEQAVRHLHNILHLKNPVDMIQCLVMFFDDVVAGLPGVDVAADDILPAICVAMTRDLGFGSHVMSFFNYLTGIWPPSGMDERVTYILVTCSIAAQHLATMDVEQMGKKEDQPMGTPTEATIGMLEDLLNCL